MGTQRRKWIFVCCLYVLFSFPFEVMDLDAGGAKDSVPPSLDSPAADFSAETEIINPVSKKKVAVKKTAAKSEPQSFKRVNVRIKKLATTNEFNFLFPKITTNIEIKPFPSESKYLDLCNQNWWSEGLKSAYISKCQVLSISLSMTGIRFINSCKGLM